MLQKVEKIYKEALNKNVIYNTPPQNYYTDLKIFSKYLKIQNLNLKKTS